MNLKQLEVFLAVAETGSFSRGAEISFITQSTVSQHISALEHEFGIRLLNRTGKGALLTAGGKVLAAHARKVLKEAREAEAALNRFKGIEEASLRVGGSNVPGSYMIPAVIPLLLSRYPGLRITLIQGDSRDILSRLAADEIEVGVVGNIFTTDGFSFTPLGRDEIKLVVPRGHRWDGREGVSLDELAGEPLVLRETGSGTGKAVSESLQHAGLNPARLPVRAIIGSNEAVKRAVAGGLGVTFVSAMSVRGELDRGELVEVAVTGLSIVRQFHLASHAGCELSPAATAFCAVMRDTFG